MSHRLVYIIAQAKNENEALDLARDSLDSIAGENLDFDSGALLRDKTAGERTFDEEWEVPTISQVCLKFGTRKCNTCKDRFKCYTRKFNDLVQEGLEKTKQQFLNHMTEIREAVANHTDNELFEHSSFKFHCLGASGESCFDVWLYDEDGAGITTTERLNEAISPQTKSGTGNEKMNVYIAPADVHY